MKNKFFTISATGKSVKDGAERVVTVVGKLVKEKVDYTDEFELDLVDETTGKRFKGEGKVERRKPIKHFTMAYSICHPDDKFDSEIGTKIATSRLESKPLGTVSSLNRTMLNEDMCNMMVFNELMYITKNIDKFIDMI